MRIEYLLLENFAVVESAMGLNKLELNFRNHKNRITLILGGNGSGKTGGILANLHPYAGLGHLEEREDADIIAPGKKGRKVIIFSTKKHEYYIEHIYQFQGEKRGRKISSFCKKDGVELNPTGLVTSFNLLIEDEFGIDINFLKLMRLGPNVINFIKLGVAERKTYMTKLIQEIDLFIKNQKTVSERSSALNSALKMAIDKKKKLNIEDLTLLNEEIYMKDKRVAKLKSDKENTIKNFFEYKGTVDSNTLGQFDSLMNDYNSRLYNLNLKAGSLKRPEFVHLNYDDKTAIEYYNSSLKELNDRKVELSSELATLRNKKFNLIEKKESLDKRSKLLFDIQNGNNENLNEVDLVNQIQNLELNIKSYEESYKDNLVPSVSKIELESDLDKLNIVLYHIKEIFKLSESTLEYFTKLYNKYGLDIDKLYSKVQKKLKDTNYALNQIMNKKNDDIAILYLPKYCTEYKKCPYYEYGQARTLIEKGKEKKDTLINIIDDCEGVESILNAFLAIRKILSLRNDNIKEYTITEENIAKSIIFSDTKYFINMDIVNQLNTHIDEYNNYKVNSKMLEENKVKLNSLREFTDQSNEINELYSQLEGEIETVENRTLKLNKKIEKINNEISYFESMISDYNVFMHYKLESSEIKSQAKIIKEKIEELQKLEEQKKEYDRREAEYRDSIAYYTYTINVEEGELYNLKKKSSLYTELEKEIEDIKQFYEYTELIKKAVSNQEGIPKEYVVFYCRALRDISNEIIHDIYGGDLELEIFDITDNKFNIPYITHGKRIADIRYGSQAEVSVATIALSFAILYQFLPKYNIILLDEIDGPLHSDNKDRLFASIESHLDKIGCEQLFWITQSKLHSDYPFNLIITDANYSTDGIDQDSIIFHR